MANVEVADRNLQLALIDEVFAERVGDYYWLSSLHQEYAAHQASVGGPGWDDLQQRLGIDHLPQLEWFIRSLPLTADDLAKVTCLQLDGDREVYTLYPGWWHGGRHFDIASLDGIGHCKTLVDLDLNSMVDPCSLAPVAELTGLRRLTVNGIDRHWDLDAIVALPALAELRFWNLASAEADKTWSSVIGALRTRGISVRKV